VDFINRLPQIITLSELRSFAKPGGALENMQMLKQGRLSVSALRPREWDFVIGLIEDNDDNGDDDDAIEEFEEDEEADEDDGEDEEEEEEEDEEGEEEAEDTLVENVNGGKRGKELMRMVLKDMTMGMVWNERASEFVLTETLPGGRQKWYDA
jgi:TATA-binding protein-associated factor Taf7